MNNLVDAKEKLQKWIKSNVEKTSKSVEQFHKDWSNLVDHKIPTKKMDFTYDQEKNEINHAINQDEKFKMTDIAISQLGGKLNIPAQFIRNNIATKSKWRKNMISNVLQDHVNNINDAFIFRTVGQEIRGIVSLQYKRYDSMELYDHFIQSAEKNGLTALYFNYDKYTTMINMVYPEPFKITIGNTEKYVVYGVKMKHGDFGTSSLTIENTIINLICSNGMIGETQLRKIHKGKRTKIEDDIVSPETIRLETKAELSLMNDAIRKLMNTENIEKFIENYQKMGELKIDLEHGYEKLKRFGMTKFENTRLKTLMQNRPEEADMDGGNNLYAMVQGVSYIAKEKREENQNERSHDLETMSYKLMKSFI